MKLKTFAALTLLATSILTAPLAYADNGKNPAPSGTSTDEHGNGVATDGYPGYGNQDGGKGGDAWSDGSASPKQAGNGGPAWGSGDGGAGGDGHNGSAPGNGGPAFGTGNRGPAGHQYDVISTSSHAESL